MQEIILEPESLLGGFHGASVVKNPAYNEGDTGLTPGLGRSLREGNGNSLQYSWMGNPLDRGAWLATVYGVAKSQTWLSDWIATIPLEERESNTEVLRTARRRGQKRRWGKTTTKRHVFFFFFNLGWSWTQENVKFPLHLTAPSSSFLSLTLFNFSLCSLRSVQPINSTGIVMGELNGSSLTYRI